MHKGRLEAFSDGVLAIIITIMVLEMKVPHGTDLAAVAGLWPVFVSYVLSFVYVGIYWNNHHHMLQAVHRVDGAVLWANLHLLFWLSLFPFVTGWMGENHFAPVPVAFYGGVLFAAAVAYAILVVALRRLHGPETTFAKAIGRDRKGRLSVVAYLTAIPFAFLFEPVSMLLYVGVAAMWLVPDRRFERLMGGVPE
ncbi:TMEM175 family protein [Pinisolibacter aquiterrae]|uniref:TMEM175 family protein n=1 Tax=Pinisolibacter aquiterrae TaxID=2815579 RepID=UPI001C3CFBEC|nr:TMEM175 family protein [Pinisolibacter aquiterrae]MBV5265930.1 DUF1211 domain-containing protein [Pinisolibacter aquiterrae]MCC8237212.1 TMEM175 family protein [Pinisolibacter aquiterrae]